MGLLYIGGIEREDPISEWNGYFGEKQGRISAQRLEGEERGRQTEGRDSPCTSLSPFSKNSNTWNSIL